LKQSVAQSSREVWNNSNSGIAPSAETVSYYNKGQVLGLLLDARIRRATRGRGSFDDVMRLAYRRFGGERGFSEAEFRATAEEATGLDLKEWWRRSVESAEELDYGDLLDAYGLQFVASPGPAGEWTLRIRDDATEAQTRSLAAWLAPSTR
jgi:predicted metalloprotease with PDZ domain